MLFHLCPSGKTLFSLQKAHVDSYMLFYWIFFVKNWFYKDWDPVESFEKTANLATKPTDQIWKLGELTIKAKLLQLESSATNDEYFNLKAKLLN